MASGRVEDLAKSFCIQFQERQRGGSDAAIVGTRKPIVRFAKSQRAAGDVLVVESQGRAQVENVTALHVLLQAIIYIGSGL